LKKDRNRAVRVSPGTWFLRIFRDAFPLDHFTFILYIVTRARQAYKKVKKELGIYYPLGITDLAHMHPGGSLIY
jgi:hypothetical protein